MNNVAKLLIAAAAVVVVTLVGLNLMPAGRGPGGSGPTVSPSPSSTPTATPTPSPSPATVFPPSGTLAADTKLAMTLDGVPLTFSVPTSGWVGDGRCCIDNGKVGPDGTDPDGASFIFWTTDTPVGVYADPCAHVKGVASPDASTADLAAAVAAVPGTDLVSGPSDVTVGGYPAKHVVLRIRDDVACTSEQFMLWYSTTSGFERNAAQLGSTTAVWIVDVDGTTVWIDGDTFKGAGTEPAQAIQQVIDSIQFE